MNRGFAKMLSVVVLAVIVAVAASWWYSNKLNISPVPTTVEQSIPTRPDTNSTGQTTSQPPGTATGEPENWKTYRSETWGIEFKYPPNFILNTLPNTFWKEFGPYRSGYDFFELVDDQRYCYIGPVRAVGIRAPDKSKTINTADNKMLEIKYWNLNDGTVFLGQANIITPNKEYSLDFNLTSLSNELIISDYKKTSVSSSVNDSCVKDFESIIATIKLTK